MTEQAEKIDLTRIEGFSDKVSWPRVGKVRLGVKNDRGLPVQTDYFVFDDETLADFPQIGEVFADKGTGSIEPKSLDIVLVSDDVRQAFPQSWRFYGKSRGLRCIGNGRQALRYVCRKHKAFDCDCETPEVDRVEVPCTCPLAENGKCEKTGLLHFLLPQITMEGVFQLAVKNTTIPRINSGLALVRAMLGRIALVPLKLRRQPVRQQAHGKQYTNFLVSIGYAGNLGEAQKLREAKGNAVSLFLPEPEAVEPETDVVYDEPQGGRPSPAQGGAGGAQGVGAARPPAPGDETGEESDAFTPGVDGLGEAPWDEGDEERELKTENGEAGEAGSAKAPAAEKKLTPEQRARGIETVLNFGDKKTGRPSALAAMFKEHAIPAAATVAELTDEQLIAVGRAIREFNQGN